MASKRTKCQRCGGGQVIQKFMHVQSGVCFDCHGTGWEDEDVTRRREAANRRASAVDPADYLPPPSAQRMARSAMNMVAGLFKTAEWDDWGNYGFDSVEDVYRTIGVKLAETVRDPVFDRAVARARARVPNHARRAFEDGLAEGLREMAKSFPEILWEGR